MSTGKQIFELACTKKGQIYKLGVLVPKNQANYNGPWDCAEFISWMVYQASQKLYGCYNNNGNPAIADAYTGYWKRDAEVNGKIITLAEAGRIKGAAVLRVAADSRIGHIVISDGAGGTIEANGTNTGVIRSTLNNRRWDFGILVPFLTYEETGSTIEIAPPNGVIYRYTNPMMVSPKVGEIQQALKSHGFDPQGIDHIYGVNTLKAVEAFQQAKGIVADGEVGEITAGLLGIALD
jgi:N-acetylmuramoyl-L-alanine amidase